jgi:hypothetical protein
MIDQHSSRQRWALAVAVVLITLVAAGLRLWRLDTFPAGLHFDEAAYGLQSEQILRGETPVFFSNYAGREALFQYTVAPFRAALGPTILAVRLPAALWSIALVPLVFALGSRLWNWRAGLWAAIAVACGPWLVHIGRIGYRTNTLPWITTAAMLLLYLALTRQRRRDWIGSGALFGLSLYTYAVVRVLPLLGPLLLIYLALFHRDLQRRSGRGIGFFTIALLVVATPLLLHFARVPSDFFERLGQVSITEAPGGRAQLLRSNLLLAVEMWGVRGVPGDFLRLPFRPAFVGIAAIPFYVGVALSLWRFRDLAHALILLWLGVMLLPIVLAADTQIHWIHAIGAAPAACLLWGRGVDRVLGIGCWVLGARDRGWGNRFTGSQVHRFAGSYLPTFTPSNLHPKSARFVRFILHPSSFILLTLWWTQATWREYTTWARRPETYYTFMQYATDSAREADRVSADQALLISEDYYRHATYTYLAPRARQAQWYDARHAVVWPRSAPWTALVSASTPTTDDVQPLLVAARGAPYTPDGLFAFIKLQGDTIPPFEPPTPFVAQFGDALELQGYNLTGDLAPGTAIHLQLYNRAIGSPDRELRLFVHVEDEQNRVLAQDDALGYDAREWQVGDQFISFHNLTLPADLPQGRLRLVAGLYDAVTGERFATTGAGAEGEYVGITEALND